MGLQQTTANIISLSFNKRSQVFHGSIFYQISKWGTE